MTIDEMATVADLECELAEAWTWLSRLGQERDRLRDSLEEIGNGLGARPVDIGPDATLIVVAQDEYEHLRGIARKALAGGEKG